MNEGSRPGRRMRGDNALTYAFGALGGFLFGYDIGVVSGAILFIQEDLGTASVFGGLIRALGFSLGPFLNGLIVSSLLLGAMVGAGSAGALSDRLGRKSLLLVAAAVFAVGSVGTALAPNTDALLLFRLVLGLAVGAVSVVVPMYLSEVAPTEVRGTLSSLNQLMITFGILFAYVVNSLLAEAEAWRWMLGLAVVPALVLLFGMLTRPETPRFLVRQGREEEARTVLERTRGASSGSVEDELEGMRRMEGREERGAGFRELVSPQVRPALVVAIGIAVIQQAIGINTIIYYAPTTLTSIGFGQSASIYANLTIGVVNVLMTLVAIYLIDRVGRKPLLLVGLVGMVTSLLVLVGASLFLGDSPLVGVVTLLGLAGFIVSFAPTWGAVMWAMLPEVLPLRVRGKAMGVATVLHWGTNFLVAQMFPLLLDSIGPAYGYLVFAVVGVFAFFFVRAVVPETKGRSLEQVEADLRERAVV